MTLTNSVVAKLAVAFVAISMMFSLAAPAQAQTAEELQATIDALMAQINALNAQIGTTGGSMSSSCVSVPAPLTMGAQNADVTALQNFLINAGQSIPAGATGYFGGQTQAALAGWQAANGVAPAVGYYGPITKAAMDAACVVVDDSTDDSDDDSTDDSDDSSDDSLSGGEADVNSYKASDEEDEIAEGDEDVAVMTAEFDVEDGDVMLERVDVTLDNTALAGNDGEADPWDAFDEMSLWVDGDKVASEDVSDEDDWDENSAGDEFTFRFTGVDTIFREDTTGEITIALSAANSVDVDGDAGDDDWVIFIDTDGLRFVDSLGLDIKEGDSSESSTFEMIAMGDNDDLDLESSDDDVDAMTFAVSEDDETEIMIFAFDLSAEDSDNDISIDNLYLDVTVGSADTDYDTVDELVDDFRIEIAGDSYDAESYTGTGASVLGMRFDVDNDSSIDADDKVTVMVYANINDVDATFDTATITASINASTADVDAEGADDVSAIGGSDVDGEIHTLRLEGFDVELSSEDTEIDENNDATSVDDEGVFELVFDVTAFGDDLYIPFGAATATDLTAGFEFSILDNNNAAVDLTGATTTISVDGDNEEDFTYKVTDGSTESFTLIVKYDPATSGSYKLRLDTVNFDTDDANGTATDAQDVSDLDIDTSKLVI